MHQVIKNAQKKGVYKEDYITLKCDNCFNIGIIYGNGMKVCLFHKKPLIKINTNNCHCYTKFDWTNTMKGI